MIGMQPVNEQQLSRVGVAAGRAIGGRTYLCTAFVEKPDAQTARRRLTVEGLPDGQYLAHAGLYAFTPEIFGCISRLRDGGAYGTELELAHAQQMLLELTPEDYFLYRIAGRALDVGTPDGYAAAFAQWREQ
jgi:UTP-glucose-1-phosphate uridylyltransferase